MRSLKKIFAVLMLAVMLAGLMPAAVFGASNPYGMKFTISSIILVMQGGESYVDVEVEAPEDLTYKLLLETDCKDVSIPTPRSGEYTGNVKHTFTISADKKGETGFYNLTVKAVDPENSSNVYYQRNVSLSLTDRHNSQSFVSSPSMEVGYAIQWKENIVAGEENILKLYIYNRGNVDMFNSKVTLTLPKGIDITNGPASRTVGSFGIGKTVTVEFPLTVDSELVTGSYPIEVTLEGVHRELVSYTDSETGKEKGSLEDHASTLKETLYVPIVGKDKETKDDTVPLLIVDSFHYGENNGVLKRGQDFTLKMTFLNTGSKDIDNVVINVLDNSGAVVPTGSSFIKFDSIKAGEKVDGAIGLRTVKDTDVIHTSLGVEMNYYYGDDSKQNQSTYPISVSIEKKPDESGADGVANPILMVTDYSFGDSHVMAGDNFPLSLTITNTSAKTLRNIKVTVADATGSVLPSEGSNSFFINSIGAGASYGRLMPMVVNRDVKGGNETLTVSMSYEDLDAKTFTSQDTITIPVLLEDRLVIDDILDPGWLMAGQQGYVQIKYYNMGQTTLNNLRVAVSGDFTIDGDSSQYVGNMANGRSDYFSFNFLPNSEGEMKGKATFTFENSQGEEQVIEKEFTFNIQPAPEWEDPGDMPMEPVKPPMPLWKKILIGAGAAAVGIGAIVFSKKHKKKKAEALELDE